MVSAKIIDGKKIAETIRKKIKAETEKLNISPGLTVVIIGADPASEIYVKNKQRAAKEVGFQSNLLRFPKDFSESQLLNEIKKLNEDKNVHGILVQLPLPDPINEEKIIMAIDPLKDVDGFHPVNLGKLLTGIKGLVPCTPSGCMEMIRSTGIDLAGKNAGVVGRSNIVGKPTALLLTAQNATVTVCHSKTKDLPQVIKQADVVVAAIGKAKMITAEMIKPGAVVIDVGINRVNGKLCGDVDFDQVKEVAAYLSPVPGGVGPLTIAFLLKNTLKAYHLQN